MTIEFRTAVAADAEGISNVVRALGTQNVGLGPDFSSERAREWIDRLGTSGTVILASDGSIPVAFGALDFSTTEPDTGLLGVWVAPDHQRRGLATAIADQLLEFARERGYRRIRGRLPEGNQAALSFLSSIGAMVPLRNPNMTFELPL